MYEYMIYEDQNIEDEEKEKNLVLWYIVK